MSSTDINPHYQRQLNTILADWKLTPATFAHKISNGAWIPAKHLLYISSRIAKGVAKGGARIIISAPPRHGKSMMTSIYTPAWILERFPDFNVILSTYGADLSVGFGRAVRDLFQDERNKDILNSRVRKDSGRVAMFQMDGGGMMASVGLGGPITGRGAHVLLIDDYIKEIKEALSPAYRDYVWNWFITTAFTRLEPGGSCIIIATRWHTDDLIGRILKEFPGQWEYIEIPAIADPPKGQLLDFLGRAAGEPLFPERYPLPKLMELKETLGSIFFNALYQQRPVDESKKISDRAWIKFIDELPWDDEWKYIRMWDLAATPDGGDYTVGLKMAYSKKTGRAIIMGVKRGQWSPETVERKVALTAELEDGFAVKLGIEEEPGASGKALTNHYKVNVVPGYTVVAIPATVKKIIRAQPLLAAAEAGKVYLLKGHWNEAFLKEFDNFPGQNDDQVDTASAAYTEISGKKIFSASWGRVAKPSNNNTNSKILRQAISRTVAASMSIRTSGATFGRRTN